MTSLAADIGGTFSRLSWPFPGGSEEQRFSNADFESLEAVIDHGMALRGIAGEAIDEMVLALPGPIHVDPVVLTNINWQVQRAALQHRYGVRLLTIVNDFQAAALGAIAEPYDRLKVLNAATPDDGPVVVAGAGTGLGMAWLPSADVGGLPRATEGGHLDFAPNSARELALLRWLSERYGHVSYERILSGDGLLDTYRFFAGGSGQAATPAQIKALADSGDGSAGDAIRLFVDVFAGYAGNLALAFNPGAGIYLCGGLTAHLVDWFDPTAFAIAFCNKGRMADVVRRIPVFLVTRQDTGLTGAKAILKKELQGRAT